MQKRTKGPFYRLTAFKVIGLHRKQPWSLKRVLLGTLGLSPMYLVETSW
jgi:hypothetical protein